MATKDADRKEITWECLYKYIYTEEDWLFWSLFDFNNIKSGCAKKKKKKDIIRTNENKEYYDFLHKYPGFKFSGDADFGDLKGLANLCMTDADASMHKFPNFSLMPCTGGMNRKKGFKNSGYNDRFHVFIYVLSEYYKQEEKNQRLKYVKAKLFGNGINDIEENEYKKAACDALNEFLCFFIDINDYCDKIYHLNTEEGKKYIEDLIVAGKEEIETQKIKYNKEDYIKYFNLAIQYWKIKKEFLNDRLPKEYQYLIDKNIGDSNIK